jgi:hypothetical protein
LIEFAPNNLINCGCKPDELWDINFGIYDVEFFVDEPKATFKPCNNKILFIILSAPYERQLDRYRKIEPACHHQVIESVRAALKL